jgi:hypothetical protein
VEPCSSPPRILRLSHPHKKIPGGEKPRDTWLFSVCFTWPQYAGK